MDNDRTTLVLLSCLLRLIHTSIILITPSVFTPFDTSSSLLLPPQSTSLTPILSWDSHYFIPIATNGYSFEAQLAFSPGLPLLLNSFHRLLPNRLGVAGVGAILSWCCTTSAAVALYDLTLALLPSSTTFAFLSSILFLLSPSAATLHSSVAYTEPLFAVLLFVGMRKAVQKNFLLSAVWCGAATAVRPMGALAGPGLLGWGLLLSSGTWRGWKRSITNLPLFVLLSLVSVSPFLALQYYAYYSLCTTSSPRPWCNSFLPLSYSWIQREYWDVGPFIYWTPSQLPNFLLSLPVILLSLSASYTYYRSLPFAPACLLLLPSTPAPSKSLFTSPNILPFIHLHTIISILLIVSSHIQIVLRVCETNPIIYWYAASWFMMGKEKPLKWGKRWVGYTVAWGAISTVLWGAFLPPA